MEAPTKVGGFYLLLLLRHYICRIRGARKVGKHRRNFKRHLVTRGQQRNWFARLQTHLLVPWIEFDSAAKRQRCQLMHVPTLQLWRRLLERSHPEQFSSLSHAVAEVRINKPGQLVRMCLQRAQK